MHFIVLRLQLDAFLTDVPCRWPVLYFKVKRVQGFPGEAGEVTSYLADTDHTSLYTVRGDR